MTTTGFFARLKRLFLRSGTTSGTAAPRPKPTGESRAIQQAKADRAAAKRARKAAQATRRGGR
ncbi:hypothetical protein LAZ40_23590 [Cereibacter sphaeroides]|uniref:hypothetical protein n=1 Tax=Rhodobacterales TaxID=204455 RepID=UPI000BBE9E36|nr:MULTISPECIES: hypothetical protein [Paracoccaceae]MCE6962025.1 hypothetical protein [Cereibacter sphaeroides]MCE6970800.1 hypothetical protein [Cereibacter sphaeroides]MCE6975604.1 hypothetical protein [Cereibacter sphaeroides]